MPMSAKYARQLRQRGQKPDMMLAGAKTVVKQTAGNAPFAKRNQGEFMKVCVFGTGAVGGTVATRLLAAGTDEISLIARGVQLKAIREHGLTVIAGGNEIKAKARIATDDPSTLPPQDVVLVTLKAHAQRIDPPRFWRSRRRFGPVRAFGESNKGSARGCRGARLEPAC
jgi:hypothetical protein